MPSRAVLISTCLWTTVVVCADSSVADGPKFSLSERPGRLEIRVGDNEFATYVYRDDKILRPYFANVHAPNGIQVTRNHPPQAGDPTDHSDMHPGIWLAFGDISGADFWRNKGRVEHVEFIQKPSVRDGKLTFAVRNRYLNDRELICTEVCRHSVLLRPSAILLLYDSEFTSQQPFAFGDQEEMGLGVRVASPLRVKGGRGRMLAADGKRNESEVRGSSPEWVDYSGEIDGEKIGMTLMPHPENFRPCWYHARDYGLLVANAFGRNALTGGPKSTVTVNAEEPLRLQFGVLIHSAPADEPVDLKAAYLDYRKQTMRP